MTKFKLVIILYLQISFFVFGQGNEVDELWAQIEESVYSSPNEAIKTAEFLLKKENSELRIGEIYFLMAKANFIKGQFDQSLTLAFQSENLGKRLKNDDLISHSSILICEIFDFLQLKKEADRFSKEIPTISLSEFYLGFRKNKKDLHDLIRYSKNNPIGFNKLPYLSFYISNELLKNKNQFYLTSKNSDVKSLYSSIGVYGIVQNELISALFGLEKKEIDDAKKHLENASKDVEKIENPFLKAEIYDRLSEISIAQKNDAEFVHLNSEILKLEEQTENIQSLAANTAFQLISDENQTKIYRIENLTKNSVIILSGLLLFLIVLILFLRYRNKKLMLTYSSVVGYLESKEKKEIENLIKPIVSTPENRSLTLLKESENTILVGLDKFESSTKFTQNEMSLSALAAQLNTNTKYLSEVINKHKQKNFNSYINELRINYITEKLKNDPTYLNYKVSYLAQESGFSSHSTFTTVFKSVVGVSPIAFVDLVKSQKQQQNEKS